MKTSMKWLSVLLALCLLIAGVTAIAVAAEGLVTAEAEKDGIRAVLKISDKDYEKTGKMTLALEVANDGDRELKNVKTSITLPASLILKDGELTKDWEAMTYRELAVNEIKFSHLKSPDIPDDPNDPNHPDNPNNPNSPNYNGGSGNADNNGETSNTSWVLLVVLGAALVVVVGVVIFLVVSGRIKKAKSLCLLLLVGTLLVSLAPAIHAAEEEASNSLTLEQEFTIEGEKVTVSATVTWEYADPHPDNSTLTRADLENALAEIAWTWYAKGSAYEYDSATLNSLTQHLCDPLCGYAGGKSKLTPFPVMENATSHSSVFTVCSGFCYDTYYTALGYPILGNKFNSLTMTLWRNTSYPDDMAILRWHTKGKDANGNVIKYNNYDTTYKVNYDCWYDTEEVKEFFRNYKTTMRPGDIIVFDSPGHAMMYVGNGTMLDANGKKYSMDTGTDGRETDGVVDYKTFEDYFFNPDNKNFDINSIGWCENSIVVARPLNILTIDDGDGDPSNDKLDPKYVLDTGLLKSRFESDKTNPLKTSGYGIDDITYTRLKYPMMTINRVNNLTPYGTVALDGTITYTVTITNNTTNWNYTTYKVKGGDADYAGVDYDELWITEQIPEGTVLESAMGAIVDGNTLRWNCQLDAGESRSFVYTVRVTGELGDTITSTGGWVANIPSNTLTNVIGGKKLPNKTIGKMTNLFEAGRDAWNSNDGYKISANVNAGTKFAEQIYQITTGLDLQLPDVQEIMDIFFHEYEFYEPYGLYLYHDSTGIHRYMYQLNEKAPKAEDQIYYDMLVPGHFGGLWCYTDEWNGQTRISETREEYLELGDIMICLDLTEAEEDGAVYKERVVEKYTIIVYLGNGSYASLNSEGRMDPIDTSFGHSSVLMHDLFVTLRPTKAYADITKEVPAFTGTAPDLTEEDKRQTYKPNPSDILLNDTACKQFAELSINDYEWIKVNGVFPGEVYSKLGMDIVNNGTDDASFATLLKYLFLDVEDESPEFREFGHHYFKLDEPKYGAEKWNEMLLYYSGYAIDDTTERRITSLKDLHPGDIVMLGSRTSRFYTTVVYQGNGDFLLNVQSLALAGIESKIWGELHFTSDKEFLGWLNSNIAPFAETLDRRGRFDPNSPNVRDLRFEAYLVLRPSRAFENINTMVKRNIKDGALTEAEKSVLAGLDYQDWKNGPKKLFNLAATSTWAYGEAGINTSVYLGSNSIYAARNLIFKYVGSKMELRMSYESEFNNNYRTMLVPNSYGGTAFASSFTLTEDMFQVGDLFCGAQGASIHGGTGTRYVIGIYQGNGRFLIVENGGPKGNTAYHDSAMIFSKNIGKEWSYYYVLRPDRIATVGSIVDQPPVYPENPSDPSLRFIDKYKLADWEKEAISKLTFEDWSRDCDSRQMTNILPWVYKAAGIEIKMLRYGYVASTYASVASAIAADDPYYGKIVVPGSYATKATGSGIKDPQIGDIFGGRVVVVGNDGANVNLYYGAIYQGNGKFLSIFDTYDAATGTKGWDKQMLTVADLDAITWDFRYTLRPDQLATAAPPTERPNVPTGPRDITTGKLTDAEKAALAALTGGQINYPSKHLYGTLPEYYRVVGITVDMTGDYRITHEGTRDKLFVRENGVLVPCEATDDVMRYFQAMMVNVYGGNQFAEGSRISLSSAVSGNLLQIGDIVAGYYADTYTVDGTEKTTNTPFTALYQGNGKFLAVYAAWDAAQGKQAVLKVQLTTEQLESLTFLYYYTLRPENLTDYTPSAPETPDTPVVPEDPGNDPLRNMITTGKLNEVEKNIIANLGPAHWNANCQSTQLTRILPWVYEEAGIDITKHPDYAALTYSNANKAIGNAANAGHTYYNAILVPGTHGAGAGISIAKNDLQIGDIFVGWYGVTLNDGTKKTQYYGAIWQGESFFVMADAFNLETGENPRFIGTMTYEELGAFTFSMRYVLRPELLSQFDAPAAITHTVTWTHEDGTVLETDYHVMPGTTPTYDGAAPVKEGYTFAGWTPEISAVTGDVTYTATFTENAAPVLPEDPGNTSLRDIITTGKLNEVEKNIIAGLTPDEWAANCPSRQMSGILPWVYETAGIDVTLHPSYAAQTFSGVNKALNGTVSGKEYYEQILVANTWGAGTGVGLALEDLQVGDIMGSWRSITLNDGTTKKTQYFGSVYLGNGTFLIIRDDFDMETGTAVGKAEFLTYEELNAISWSMRYVLRPEQLSRYDAPAAITHTVTWKNEDGTVLETDYHVKPGTTPTYDGAAPVKEGYTFAGWTPEISAVTGDVTYTATFTETPVVVETYTVIWKNADGTVLETDENVAAGTIPTYDGKRPYNASEKVGFAGWDQEIAAVTGDITYTATFAPLRDAAEKALTEAEKEVIANLTLTDWNKNVGSRTLEKMLPWVYKEAGIDITSTAHGYVSRTSAQVSNALNGSSATGKDYYTKLAVEGSYGQNVTGVGTNELQIGDIFVAAYVWASEDKTNGTYMYYVAIYQGNDTFLVAYDKEAYLNSSDQVKRTGASGILSFAEIEADHVWAYRYILRPSQLYVAPAPTPNTYNITWMNGDEVLEIDENVPHGEVPTYDGLTPTKEATAEYTYTFSGWTPTVEAATGDITYTATFTENAITGNYTIIWKNADGTVLETDENVAAGTIPTYDGKRPYNASEKVGFAGWDQEIAAVTGDITYTATFKPLRDLRLSGTLTEEEKSIIANLTPADYKAVNNTSIQFTYLFPWIYKEAGIDVTTHADYTSLTYSKTNTAMGNSANAGYYFYNKMLVTTRVKGEGLNIEKADLQIGDIFIGWYNVSTSAGNKAEYHGAVWQGDRFLVVADDYAADATNAPYVTYMTYEDLDAINWSSMRFVLRPSNLALRDIADGALTEAEKAAIAGIGKSNWASNCDSTQLTGILPWVYEEAGINVTNHPDYTALSYSNTNKAIGNAANAGHTYYNAILVSGTHSSGTGVSIAKDDLQIGDIFVGWYGVKLSSGTSKTQYYGAVWQGDSFFVMADAFNLETGDNPRFIGTMTYEELGAFAFSMRYVLRPDQLAN